MSVPYHRMQHFAVPPPVLLVSQFRLREEDRREVNDDSSVSDQCGDPSQQHEFAQRL